MATKIMCIKINLSLGGRVGLATTIEEGAVTGIDAVLVSGGNSFSVSGVPNEALAAKVEDFVTFVRALETARG